MVFLSLFSFTFSNRHPSKSFLDSNLSQRKFGQVSKQQKWTNFWVKRSLEKPTEKCCGKVKIDCIQFDIIYFIIKILGDWKDGVRTEGYGWLLLGKNKYCGEILNSFAHGDGKLYNKDNEIMWSGKFNQVEWTGKGKSRWISNSNELLYVGDLVGGYYFSILLKMNNK